MKKLVIMMAILVAASAWTWADEATGADPQTTSLSAMSVADLTQQGDIFR